MSQNAAVLDSTDMRTLEGLAVDELISHADRWAPDDAPGGASSSREIRMRRLHALGLITSPKADAHSTRVTLTAAGIEALAYLCHH